MTISIIANFKAKSDQKETLEALLKSVIEPTLNEEGCLKYELYISENDSSRYFFLEEWRSREDLDIHIASDYIQSLFGNIQSLIESSDIRSLAKVNSRASNSPFQQLNSFLDQIVSVYFYTVLLISENI